LHANSKSWHRKFDSFDDQGRHPSWGQQQQPKWQEQEAATTKEIGIPTTSRRRVLFGIMFVAATQIWQPPQTANAYSNDGDNNVDNNRVGGIVAVRLESPKDTLGVEIYDTKLRGKNIVAIRRIVVPNKNNRLLKEGMILRPNQSDNGYTSRELVERLRSGPYPLEISFANLAAGGDAISDLGSSIVTPKDALDLAQKTETKRNNDSTALQQPQGGVEYSITTIQKTQNECAIKSRRNDVLEIDYEASYVDAERRDKLVYDASAFRGTGNRPYQMVLGSGDMIPGVDQGLYDMCPGEKRLLRIPPILGHGPNSRKLYRIPDNYLNLEWKVGLVTIDSTIREDNNVVSREERESRFAY